MIIGRLGPITISIALFKKHREVFYELLSGTVPFKGDNAVEIALKQLKESEVK